MTCISKKNKSLPAIIASQVAEKGTEAGMLPIPPRADHLNCLYSDFLICSLPPRAHPKFAHYLPEYPNLLAASQSTLICSLPPRAPKSACSLPEHTLSACCLLRVH